MKLPRIKINILGLRITVKASAVKDALFFFAEAVDYARIAQQLQTAGVEEPVAHAAAEYLHDEILRIIEEAD